MGQVIEENKLGPGAAKCARHGTHRRQIRIIGHQKITQTLGWSPTIAEIQMVIRIFGASPPIPKACLIDRDGTSVIRSTQRDLRKLATPTRLTNSSTPQLVTTNLTRPQDAGRKTLRTLLLVVIVTHRAKHADMETRLLRQINASVVRMVPISSRNKRARSSENVPRPIRLRRLQDAGQLLTILTQ